MDNNVLVSINCITYNHEKYISDAIEGFLNQKTDFNFEILIGDDCSTDNTKKIINNYIKKYPEKIRLVKSEKNIGARQNSIRLQKKSRGKYIAICEGDDYWTDCNKLQKQIDYMESNPGCTMSFHNAIKKNDSTQLLEGEMIDTDINNRTYNAGEIARLGFIPTASKVYLKEVMDNPPEFYINAIVGDYPSQLIATSKGYAYYFDDIMSVYRVGIPTSAMSMWKLKSNEQLIKHNRGYLEILDGFNEYTNFKYKSDIEKIKRKYEFNILNLEGNISKVKSKRYEDYYRCMTKKSKIKLYMIAYVPKLYSILIKLKNRR